MNSRQTVKLIFNKSFDKHLAKAEPKIQEVVRKRLKIFIVNPFDPQLNNHKLTGRYRGYRSININGDWRALYIEGINNRDELTATFEALGTHSELYK